MKQVFITAGHSDNSGQDNGAVTEYGNEGVEARELVTMIAKNLYKKGFMTITDDDDWNLAQTIAFEGTKVTEASYCIDIHFNAFNEKSEGTEMIIAAAYNAKELELAKNLAVFTGILLETPLRGGSKTGVKGVKIETESQHSRLGILSSSKCAKANNVLVEVCFISNPKEMEKYRANREKLAEGYAVLIAAVLNKD